MASPACASTITPLTSLLSCAIPTATTSRLSATSRSNDMARPPSFAKIYARAAKRKGGEAALKKLLPRDANLKALAKLGDDRILAEMAQRVFSAGFVWKVIEQK